MIRKLMIMFLCLILMVSSVLAGEGQILDGRWLCSDIQGYVTADTPADVKNDFAIYVNKDWILQATIPEGESLTGAAAEAIRALDDRLISLMKNKDMTGHDAELVRKLYALVSDWDYRNEQGTKPIMPQINALKAIDSVNSLLEFMISEDNLLSILPLTITVSADPTNPDIYITQILVPGLMLGDSAEYLARTQAGDLKFRQHQQVGLYMLQRLDFSEEEANAIIENGIAFDAKLAEHIKPKAAQYQADYLQSTLNYYSEEELISLAGNFPVMDMIKTSGFSGGKRFLVKEPDYLSALQTVFIDENVGLIRDWLLMKTATSAAPFWTGKRLNRRKRLRMRSRESPV